MPCGQRPMLVLHKVPDKANNIRRALALFNAVWRRNTGTSQIFRSAPGVTHTSSTSSYSSCPKKFGEHMGFTPSDIIFSFAITVLENTNSRLKDDLSPYVSFSMWCLQLVLRVLTPASTSATGRPDSQTL